MANGSGQHIGGHNEYRPHHSGSWQKTAMVWTGQRARAVGGEQSHKANRPGYRDRGRGQDPHDHAYEQANPYHRNSSGVGHFFAKGQCVQCRRGEHHGGARR
jgi:hypothetical protein